MRTSTEKLIAAALLGNDADKEAAMRRITCNGVASRAMFCGCGAIHDERKIHVVEVIHADGTEQVLCGCCPACFEKNLQAIENVAKKSTKDYVEAGQTPPVVRVATWKKFIHIETGE